MKRDQTFWDNWYLLIADAVSKLSRDEKVKVGALLVKQHNIISFSYNGTAAGADNQMRDENGKTLPTVLHAETNVLGKAAAMGLPTWGTTLYCTHSPCVSCAKAIYQAGVKRVVFEHYHDEGEGAEFLSNLGVDVDRKEDINVRSNPSSYLNRALERIHAIFTESKPKPT